MLFFDIETDGLLPTCTTIHVLCLYDDESQEYEVYSSNGQPVKKGLARLLAAPAICGHHVIGFDLPVIAKLYGMRPVGVVYDTLVLSKLAYPEIKGVDFQLHKEGRLPGQLIGSYSLAAWGHRLKEFKGDFDGPWETWSQEMEDYCVQDVKVTHALYSKIMRNGLSPQAVELEHKVAAIVFRQSEHGFYFDTTKAEFLYADLLKKQRRLTKTLREFFPPWYMTQGETTPKRGNKYKGHVTGATYTKIKYTEFNPGSRFHVADRLKQKYGWKPTEYTEDGAPKLDEKVLDSLPYPEAKYLSEYYMISKRIGMLAEGKVGWLEVVKDNRIRGRVDSVGAVTRRMTHNRPNMAQVPRIGSPYGKECRELFTVPEGYSLVGIDAAGIELRCLAHYMAVYDGGEYAKIVAEGDVHTRNQQATGLPTRNQAKTFIYAFLYGAGDYKIGTILGKGAAAGKLVKERFFNEFPALEKLKGAVENAARTKGELRGIDGGAMKVRSVHAALNTLLQGAAAVIMKQALVLLDAELQRRGLAPGKDYEFVANVHDEWQMEVRTELADLVGRLGCEAITAAGVYFGFRCELKGDYKKGKTWADTH